MEIIELGPPALDITETFLLFIQLALEQQRIGGGATPHAVENPRIPFDSFQNLITNSLLLTRSLTGNVNSR